MGRYLRWFFDKLANISERDVRRFVALMCIIVVVARIVLAVTTPHPKLIEDAAGYDSAARRLLSDGYYAWVYPHEVVDHPSPNAMVLPGYPAFLSVLYAPFGPDIPAQPLVSIIQAVLSGLLIWGIYLIATRLASPTVGLTAASLSILYPPYWWSYRFVLTEEVFTLLCVWAGWTLLVAIDPNDKQSKSSSYVYFAATGLLAAAAIYVRAAAGAWIVMGGLILIVFEAKNRKRNLRGGAIVAVVILLCMAPWWVRNARIYDRFVPFNTLSGLGKLCATLDNPDDPTEIDYAFANIQFGSGHLDNDQELAYNQVVTTLASERASEAFRADATEYLGEKLKRVAVSVLTYHPNPFGGLNGIGAIPEVIHLFILMLAANGLRLRGADPRIWAILVSLPLALIAVYSTILIMPRYLFPMMPFVIVLAAIGLNYQTIRSPQQDYSDAPDGNSE